MADVRYAYSGNATRNPFRYLLAIWRLVSRDPTTSTEEAAVVELGFARSRWARRLARWDETWRRLAGDPRTAPALEARAAFGPIVLDRLGACPPGSLGRVFHDHCRARGLDPNLVHVPPDDETGWLLNHLYQTHDIWHVVTGWGNDLPGEVGLGTFYCGQLGSPTFFGFMLALILLNVIVRRDDLDGVIAAASAGYAAGRAAEPMFGADWDALWDIPLPEVRRRFGVQANGIVGEGVRAAA